jgi:hypothetical protein
MPGFLIERFAVYRSWRHDELFRHPQTLRTRFQFAGCPWSNLYDFTHELMTEHTPDPRIA